MTHAAQREEARLVYRLCACLSVGGRCGSGGGGDGVGGGDLSDAAAMGVPLWLFCRFVGAAIEAGLERVGRGSTGKDGSTLADGEGLNEQPFRSSGGGGVGGGFNDCFGGFGGDYGFSRAREFDAGQAAHAARGAWWPEMSGRAVLTTLATSSITC